MEDSEEQETGVSERARRVTRRHPVAQDVQSREGRTAAAGISTMSDVSVVFKSTVERGLARKE